MEGDGDFRSEEVCRLRDEADIIVTNPPFSLFREFVDWIFEAEKDFLIIGNMNAITYKNIFPRIAANEMWLGVHNASDMVFAVPEGAYVAPKDKEKAEKLGYVGNYTRLGNSCWYSNLEHGRRHEELKLMTIEENLRYSRHKEIKGKSFEEAYPRYDNYDAIEVGFTDAIPSDYDGVMGVPISFLDKYCPEQFEIVAFRKGADGKDLVYSICRERDGSAILQSTHPSMSIDGLMNNPKDTLVNGKSRYARILIRQRQSLE